ncbi:hypothetical protein TWF281_002204 [Arthrobotrys megalospora]
MSIYGITRAFYELTVLVKGDILEAIHSDAAERRSNSEIDAVFQFLEQITPIKHGSQHSSISTRRQLDTGQWLLESSEYQNWLKQNKRILHCRGIPGAGKTFLASKVIDHLLNWCASTNQPPTSSFSKGSQVGIAYIYCDYKREAEQTISNMLASLLIQLVRHQRFAYEKMGPGCKHQYSPPEPVQQLYQRYCRYGTTPSVDEIAHALRFTVITYSRVFLVVDALDECQTSNYCRQDLIQHIFRLRSDCKVNIFTTSRDIQDITNEFRAQGGNIVEIRACTEDLRKYLNSRIGRSRRRVLLDHSDLIETEIVKAADGIFLLAKLHFQSIEYKTSPRQLKEALEALTRGETAYQIAYGNIMERINAQNPDFRRLANQVLSWVICAERPLTILELQHALAVEPGICQGVVDFNDLPEQDLENLPEADTVISVCAGLVRVDEGFAHTRIVQLIHFTAQEYFQRNWNVNEAHTDITKTCIRHLSRRSLTPRAYGPRYELYHGGYRVRYDLPHALDHYAVENWGHHARKSASEIVQSMALDLLRKEAFIQSCGYMASAVKPVPWNITYATGMHIAAHFGLRECVERFLHDGADLQALDRMSYGKSPLWWAAAGGYVTIVELLADKGASFDTEIGFSTTPLSEAASSGHTAVVELLLKRGVHPDGKLYDSPLSRAAENGHKSVAEILIREGADPNRNGSSLVRACRGGHVAVVDLLLRSGANPNRGENREYSWSLYTSTPLFAAARYGHTAVVESLIGHGVNLGFKDRDGRTAFLIAARYGSTTAMELLIRQGVDLNSQDNMGETALIVAAAGGHTEAVKLLASHGADLSSQDHTGDTALIAAAAGGHTEVAKLLVGHGANLDSQDHAGDTALIAAAAGGHTATFDLLIGCGADFNVKNNMDITALIAAAAGGHTAAVRLLIKYGADLNARSKIGSGGVTALAASQLSGHKHATRLLIRAGADQSG